MGFLMLNHGFYKRWMASESFFVMHIKRTQHSSRRFPDRSPFFIRSSFNISGLLLSRSEKTNQIFRLTTTQKRIMTTIPAQNFAGTYSAKGLCRIVGFACLAGFLVDILALSFPINLGNIEWRIGFLQQFSDRSVIALFGLALIMYSIMDFRRWRRRLAMFCLVTGVVFILSCILVIRDGLTLQQTTLTNITNQASQLQTQIEQAQKDPKVAPNLSPQQLEQAAQTLSTRAVVLKENTKTTVLKTSVSSVGNLIVIGLALIGLGQYGARPPKV